MYQSNIEILDSLSTLDDIWYEKKMLSSEELILK